jgi:hypothetical protein
MLFFNNLPPDMIHQILCWEGSLKYRNGKWVNQIQIKEETKKCLNHCIQRKYKSILKSDKMVVWKVNFPNTTKSLSLFILKNLKHIFVSTYYIVDFSDPKSLYGNQAIEMHHWLT